MARPQKEGLDYFPIDVHNDDKLDLIEAKFELIGWALIVKLWRKIYSTYGYYYPWTEKEILLFRKAQNVDINLLNDVIKYAIELDIFNKELFNKYNILSSNGIQKRYLESIKRRKQQTLIEEYCLFDVNEYKNELKADINLKIESINTQSKVK